MAKKKEKTVVEDDSTPRGVAKSGRFWKQPKEKFRKLFKTMPTKTKDQHLKLRAEIKKVKELSKSIKEDKKQVSWYKVFQARPTDKQRLFRKTFSRNNAAKKTQNAEKKTS